MNIKLHKLSKTVDHDTDLGGHRGIQRGAGSLCCMEKILLAAGGATGQRMMLLYGGLWLMMVSKGMYWFIMMVG